MSSGDDTDPVVSPMRGVKKKWHGKATGIKRWMNGQDASLKRSEAAKEEEEEKAPH